MAAAPATLGWEVEKSEGWEGADSNETHQITTVGGGVVGVRRACNIRLWGWLMVSAARTCDTSRAVTHGTTEESSAKKHTLNHLVGSSLQNHML